MLSLREFRQHDNVDLMAGIRDVVRCRRERSQTGGPVRPIDLLCVVVDVQCGEVVVV